MPRYLILTLQGVFQAWGKHSYETYRPTELYPTRSGITGFLAAALGITRDRRTEYLNLDHSYKYAVRCDAIRPESGAFDRAQKFRIGRKMTDYHTVQNVRTVGGKIKDPKLTYLTYREYLEDQSFTVAICETGSTFYNIDELGKALQKPHFSLYLGRKSCPLGVPPFRAFCEADNLYCALAKQKPTMGMVYSEEEPQERRFFVIIQRDVPIGDRFFGVRKVYSYDMEVSPCI